MNQVSVPLDMIYPYKYSFIDQTGRVIIDAHMYQRVESFSEGLAPVWLVNEGWGFIDKTGTVTIKPQFEQTYGFSEGLAGVQIGGMWGFIDKSGRVAIEPQFEWAHPFHEGIAVVVKGTPRETSRPHLPGVVVKKKLMIKVVEHSILSENSNAENSEKLGSKEIDLIDRNGKSVLSGRLNELQLNRYENARFSEGLIVAYDAVRKRFGFVDKKGRLVIEPIYNQVAPFSEGLARVSVVEGEEEKVGFIDHSGRFVISPKFNTDADFRRNSTDFSEGLASLTENLRPTVTEEEKFVYLHKNGEIALFTSFFYAGPFRDGRAAVYDGEKNKWGFIDKTGKIVIPVIYDLATDFADGLACVGVLRRALTGEQVGE